MASLSFQLFYLLCQQEPLPLCMFECGLGISIDRHCGLERAFFRPFPKLL